MIAPAAQKVKYELLVKAVQELSLARELKTVMEIVRNTAREMTGADGATFILRENDHCYYADENAISPLWKGLRFPMRFCISGWVMLNKTSVVVEDIYKDERIPIEAYKPTFVRSLAMVPIRTIDPIGAIGNYWASQHTPSAEQIDLLQSLADVTAVTLENIRVYNELEQRVKERTAELQSANKKLEIANNELETLAYSLSHDLRSPLRNISLTLEKLVNGFHNSKSDPARPLTDKMFSKIVSMQTLMNDLLTLFKMGHKTLELENISMKDIVKNICDEQIEGESASKVKFEMSDLPDATADSVLMKQVWSNLISNAIKYSKNNPDAVISVDFGYQNNEIIYCIKDNGVGFDMQYYSRMFKPFQRFHNKEDFDGTGIGLALVDRIVSMHGGKIWANSEPGKGASFYFSLPRFLSTSVIS